MTTCPLCGFVFEEGRQSHCTQCPLNQGCRIICCPNCNYEFPPEPTLVRMIKNWSSKRKERKYAREKH